MKSKFVKTLLVSSLVATIATGCGDDKDNNKSADTQAKDAGSLVFVDWGGTNTDARIEKNIKPFEEKTGIKVTVVTPSDYAKLIAMVENGTTEWDVMNCDAYWGVYASKKGYLEPIDYKTVTEKLDKAVELEHVVGAEVYDSVISCNSGI